MSDRNSSPKNVVLCWIDAFNRADVDGLAALYAEDAINHQVAECLVEGREAIRAMFAAGFAITTMVCIPENLFDPFLDPLRAAPGFQRIARRLGI